MAYSLVAKSMAWPNFAKNLNFMKKYQVYCISEAGSERYERSKKRITDLGLEFVHVPAVRPSTLVDYDRTIRRRYWGCDMNLGEVGCFLAHRSAWKMISEKESNPVLVVEDDVGFSADAAHVFVAAAKRYDSKRDFIRFYSDWVRPCYRKVSITPEVILGIPLSPGNCSVAYMIGPEVAQQLCSHSKVFHCPSDDFLGQSWVHGVREIH
jgi:GR25 family glycosyltransferase involved in LPS biosynthesis